MRCTQALDFKGKGIRKGCAWGGGGKGGVEVTTFTQMPTNSEPSLGCNGDGHMLQSAAVSKETYHETMRHNNSFPQEASGVEPIVCTLLRLWMLPLLRRAYINLAGSKAALWCSLAPLASRTRCRCCRKKTRLHPSVASPGSQSRRI